MKKILILCAAMALFATSAFAVGADLSLTACPGIAGATADAGTLDCAGGQFLSMLATFMPGESAPDLTGIDAVIDLQVGGDLNSSATFWDFEVANVAALSNSHVRPANPACSTYTNTWSISGSGEGSLAGKTSASTERIKALAYRPGPLAYTLNQKLFGMAINVDASTSSEAGGGTGVGCPLPVAVVLNDIFPRLVSGNPTMDLGTPSIFGNCVTINGATAANCAVIPVKKHTWGQLKSLYRN
jgi:hypothetical protein